jgi:hypothetical protein
MGWVVSVTPQQCCIPGKDPLYPLARRLCGPQSWPGQTRKKFTRLHGAAPQKAVIFIPAPSENLTSQQYEHSDTALWFGVQWCHVRKVYKSELGPCCPNRASYYHVLLAVCGLKPLFYISAHPSRQWDRGAKNETSSAQCDAKLTRPLTV